ncbi:RagB/SusD family nutrient uptake outer membrane protein [Pedobacter steynii]
MSRALQQLRVIQRIFFTTGLTGDELELRNKSNQELGAYYFNNISPIPNTWAKLYNMIFIANSAIEELSKGSGLTPRMKSQLLGESKFVRAFSYFYLVNLYGSVPLTTTTDYKVNRLLGRSDPSFVYQQIIEDLKSAVLFLNENYVGKDGITITAERIRPNKWTALALLARTYLYVKNYDGAIEQASAVINHKALYELVDLNSVFVKNNREAIWQLQPVSSGPFTKNTREGQLLKLLSIPYDFYPVYLTESLLKSFEDRDVRRTNWVGKIIDNTTVPATEYNYANKYKIGREDLPVNEYSTVFRLGELYLIRAEANIYLNNISEGISDLNVIRKRATDLNALIADQLPQLSSTLTKGEALRVVEEERRHELFTEWGHRWFDLKRTGRIDAVLSSKPGWQSTDQLFPIPNGEILGANPNMKGAQNPGYSN